MAFQLPSKLSPLRELFELDHLAKVGNGEYTTTYAEARMAARRVRIPAWPVWFSLWSWLMVM